MKWGKKQPQPVAADRNAWWPAAPAWIALPAVLDAVSAAPTAIQPRELLAVRLAELAVLPPALPRNTRGLLPGFIRRPDADQLQDCRITKRALTEFGGLLDQGDAIHGAIRGAGCDVAALHAIRGALFEGLLRFDLAVPEFERAAALVPWERANVPERAGWLHQKAAVARAAAGQRQALSHDELVKLQGLAERIGAKIVNVISFAPTQWIHHAGRPADMVFCASFLQRVAEAEAHPGLRQVGWVENPRYPERFGHRTASALHVDDAGTVLVVSGGHKNQVVDINTLLSDGTIVKVVPNRGRTHFEPGPWIDGLYVDPMPLADALAIHHALVRLNLARRPGTSVVPMRDAADCLMLEERERQARVAFRVSEGLTEIEVRGTGFRDADLAMFPAQSAARAAIAAAQAEHAETVAKAA